MTFHDVTTWGATGDGVTDDAPAIQAALDALTANAVAGSDLNTLYFPPGVYTLGAPLTVGPYGDHAFLKLEIRGAGKHNTKLFAAVWTRDDILQLQNDGAHYVASWTIRDIQFGPCQRAIVANNATYSEVLDCAFKGNGWGNACYGIELLGNTSHILFRGCWWYHTGNVLKVTNGTVRLDGCTIGEDAGAVWVHGSLNMSGCEVFGASDKMLPLGFADMGPSAFIVEGGSQFLATGNILSAGPGNLINTDQPKTIILQANGIVQWNGGAVIKSKRLYSGSATLNANSIWFRGTGEGKLWDCHLANTVAGAIVRDNRVAVDATATASAHPTLLSAADNIVAQNLGATWLVRS